MSVTESHFNYIRQLVLERSAIVIEEGKEYLVESRVRPVAKIEGFDGIDHLVEAMRKNSNNGLQEQQSGFHPDLFPENVL